MHAPARRTAASAALALALACDGGGDAPDGDAQAVDARAADARPIDATPIDAADAGPPFSCQPLQRTAAEACAVASIGQVTACSVDPGTGAPSQNGSLAVRRADGSTGYLCASTYDRINGFGFNGDRVHPVDAASACCGGPAAAMLDWPAADPLLGLAHAPTHIKPWETATLAGGDVRHNPFAIIVSSPAAAATFNAQRQQWLAWGGDGQPHAAPDGTGSYWFEPNPSINYVVVPTVGGDPLIIIGPEPSRDPGYTTPIGHPTLGACADHGGAPMAFIGGEVRGTTLTNHSGRFGHAPGLTLATLRNAAALFNCYGITIANVAFTPP